MTSVHSPHLLKEQLYEALRNGQVAWELNSPTGLPRDYDANPGEGVFRGRFPLQSGQSARVEIETTTVGAMRDNRDPLLGLLSHAQNDGALGGVTVTIKDEQGQPLWAFGGYLTPDSLENFGAGYQSVIDNGQWLQQGYDNNPSLSEASRRLRP
ncbi:MAG: hypothetical protein SFZ03_03520 [Candidatus Melainabacteria bacterium]|nr:hypothetical protein [Candidatus Melainabacteria bacterium]